MTKDEILFAIQEVVAHAGGEWPDTAGEPEVLRRVKMLARMAASHGQAPAGAGMGHTDGGRNMFYEGRFDGESQREQQARLRWANDMRAAFERHTGNGWFDKDWRTETGLWSSAWHACLAAQPSPTAQAADSVQEDAARYRCLRRWKGQEHEPPFTVQHEIDGTLWGGDLDAAIDSVRKQGAQHDPR